MKIDQIKKVFSNFEKAVLSLFTTEKNFIREYSNGATLPEYLTDDEMSEEADSICSEAQALLYREDYDRAETLYELALSLFNYLYGPANYHVQHVLDKLAYIYRIQQQPEKVETLFQSNLQDNKLESGNEHFNLIWPLNKLASHYFFQHKYHAAAKCLEQALSLKRSFNDDRSLALTTLLDNLGLTYLSLGSYERAEDLFNELLKIQTAELELDHPSTLMTQCNLGVIYCEVQQYKKAKAIYQKVLDSYIRLNGAGSYCANEIRGRLKNIDAKLKMLGGNNG